MHLFEKHSGLRERCERGEVLFGTVDSFLIWRLTGGRVHATDVTNASRTLLFDITTGEWSDELLKIFNVPRAMMPQVRPSSGIFGEVDDGWLGASIPIAGCAGDQQSSAFAHGCVEAGDAKTTYGTGAFLLESTGAKPVLDAKGLLATPGCSLGPGPALKSYCLEGSVFVAGALVGWLRDGLGLIERSSDIEPLARSVSDSGGVVLVPALAGLGTPHWDPFARGLIVGLTRSTEKSHIARAALDAIALSVAEVLGCLEASSGHRLPRLRVDGGACVNDLLMQTQADVLGVPVDRPAVLETTALGAGLLAGLATDFYPSAAAVSEARSIEKTFHPQIDESQRRQRLDQWRDAVGRCRGWARPS
jgi:glycerol kinase